MPALNGQGGSVIDAISILLVLARWLHFASVVVVFGGSLFWLYEWQDFAGLPWTARATERINRAAAAVAALSGIAWLVATIANMTGDFAGVIDRDTLHAFFLETSFGPFELSRLGLLAVLVALAAPPGSSAPRFIALTAFSGLLLVSQAWLGHAAEGGSTLCGCAMVAAYATHVLAAGAWVGGLLPLLLAIIERRHPGTDGDTFRVLSRYSAIAVAAVSMIVVSGIANTAFHAGGNVSVFLFSSYGAVLLAKLSLVAAMLVLASINRVILMPRLKGDRDGLTSHTLERIILLECVCGLLVLGAAAILGITPPPQRH